MGGKRGAEIALDTYISLQTLLKKSVYRQGSHKPDITEEPIQLVLELINKNDTKLKILYNYLTNFV